MKRILLLWGLCGISVLSIAQTETFDITTFIPPKDWKKEIFANSAIKYTSSKGNSYCILGIYQSTASKGTIEIDFNEEWQELVVKKLNPDTISNKQKAEARNGYANMIGLATFTFEGAKSMTMLSVYSGYGIRTSILVLTNNEAYLDELEGFAASISLKKPSTNETTAWKDPVSSSSLGLTQVAWKQTRNHKDGLGNYAGYSTNTYEFRSNNTYKFSRVDFQSYTPKYYLEDEEGTYKINGDKITLTALKSYYHTHQRQPTDPIIKSGKLNLQAVQYVFQIANINGTQTILLSPVDGKETRRDGVFTFWMNGEKTKSYAYKSSQK